MVDHAPQSTDQSIDQSINQSLHHRSQSTIIACTRLALLQAIDDSENVSEAESEEDECLSFASTTSINDSVVSSPINNGYNQSITDLQHCLDTGTEAFNEREFEAAIDWFSLGLSICPSLPITLSARHYSMLLARRSRCLLMLSHESTDKSVNHFSPTSTARRALDDAGHAVLLLDHPAARLCLAQALMLIGSMDEARDALLNARRMLMIDTSPDELADMLTDEHSHEEVSRTVDQLLDELHQLTDKIEQTKILLRSPPQKQSTIKKAIIQSTIQHSGENDRVTKRQKLTRDEKRIKRFQRWLHEGKCFAPFIHIQSTDYPINQSTRSVTSNQPVQQSKRPVSQSKHQPLSHSLDRAVNRGVFAVTDIRANSLIASISSSRIISLSHAMTSTIGKMLISMNYPQDAAHSMLAAYLHYHMFYSSIHQPIDLSDRQSPSYSPFKSYLDLLPPKESFHSLPLFYTSELTMLAGTDIADLASDMRREMRGEFDLMIDCLKRYKKSHRQIANLSESWRNKFASLFSQEKQSNSNQSIDSPFGASASHIDVNAFLRTFTFDQFMYYRLLILSRVFALPLSNSHELCLVPVADMFNAYLPDDESHNQSNNQFIVPEQCHWHWDGQSQSLMIRSERDVPQGAELRHSYGAKDSRRWLLHYGVVPVNNVAHHCVIGLQTGGAIVNLTEKLTLMRHFAEAQCKLSPTLRPPVSNQSSNQSFTLPFLLSYSAPLTRMSFAMLRLYHCTSSEMATARTMLQRDAYLQPISASNEAAVLSCVALAAQSLLARHVSGREVEVDHRKITRWQRKIESLSCHNDDDSIRQCRLLRNQIACIRFMHAERHILLFYAHLKDRVDARIRQARATAGHTRASTLDNIRVEALGELEHDHDAALDEYWKLVFVPTLAQHVM